MKHRSRKGTKYLPKVTLYEVWCENEKGDWFIVAAYKNYEDAKKALERIKQIFKNVRRCGVWENER